LILRSGKRPPGKFPSSAKIATKRHWRELPFEDMAQLRLSTMLRVGSNTMLAASVPALTMLVAPGKNGWLGIRAGASDQWE